MSVNSRMKNILPVCILSTCTSCCSSLICSLLKVFHISCTYPLMMDITLFSSCASSLIEATCCSSLICSPIKVFFISCTSPLIVDINLFSSCVSSLIEAISLLLEIASIKKEISF